jgi:CheY-like chemotaxis protein
MRTIIFLDAARRRLPDGSSWLRRSGWTLQDAATPDEALRFVAASRPSLVIVDLQKDAEFALEAVRALRADPGARDVPLLALTPPDHAEAARDAGADHVFAGEAVLEEIRRVLSFLERAAPRVPVDASVAYWRDGQPTEGRLTDISSSGFFTSTNEPQPVGARLEISFKLPHDRWGKTVTGEVIVVRRNEGPNPGFAARFFRLTEKASLLIKEYVSPRAPQRSS